MSSPQRGEAVRMLHNLRMQEPPTTRDEVYERLNILEEIVAAIDPDDDFQAAILEIVNEINDAIRDLDMGGTAVDTENLPVGLQGQAVVPIPNGQTGVATFDFAGGRYAARIEADETIGQFENVRIKGANNLATPIPTEEGDGVGDRPRNRKQVYSESVNSGEDILDNDMRPAEGGSSFRVTVQLDTTAVFATRVKPDDNSVSDFNQQFNQGTALGANQLFEFTFDPDTQSQYNFRAPSQALTVEYLRVQELLESQ